MTTNGSAMTLMATGDRVTYDSLPAVFLDYIVTEYGMLAEIKITAHNYKGERTKQVNPNDVQPRALDYSEPTTHYLGTNQPISKGDLVTYRINKRFEPVLAKVLGEHDGHLVIKVTTNKAQPIYSKGDTIPVEDLTRLEPR